ncbi:hypothetical protein [Siculibacillus lacustris]|uniref:hypothetical protein n=1 Tax=Siculibacillus lacustris TaxID=1549641 RepID=UPI0013F163E2|nr:hypothetical protein [Siculibacillus lacustris]
MPAPLSLEGHRPSAEESRARRARNRAIGWVLVGLVALFYVMTLAKLGLHLGVAGM